MQADRNLETEFKRHVNPDGTLGGTVSLEAQIGKNVFVHKRAYVLGACDLPDGSTVDAGVILTPEAQIRFTPKGAVIS